MKYDDKHEQALVKYLQEKTAGLESGGKKMMAAGTKIMQFGLGLMLLGLIGLLLLSALF